MNNMPKWLKYWLIWISIFLLGYSVYTTVNSFITPTIIETEKVPSMYDLRENWRNAVHKTEWAEWEERFYIQQANDMWELVNKYLKEEQEAKKEYDKRRNLITNK